MYQCTNVIQCTDDEHIRTLNDPIGTFSHWHIGTLKTHVWHLFVIRTKQRNKLQQHLTNNGIQTLIHYPIPPHQQMAYKQYNTRSFPITEQIHNECLSLPISPVMTPDEVATVVEAVNQFDYITNPDRV